MLSGDRPVQLVIAGKAHPRDDEGKRLVQHLFTFKWAPEVGGRVVYLDDYDLSSAARMVRGCDVWLNLPRPPLEASGTSGMKSAVNGGLQLSVLDGWWAEGYDGTNGWALNGDEDADHGAQDHRDGVELHRLLERGGRARVLRARRRRPPAGLAAAGQALAGDERPGVLRHADGAGLREAVLQRTRLTFREFPKYNPGMIANGIAHFDVFGPEPEALHAFYARVFGWEIDVRAPATRSSARPRARRTAPSWRRSAPASRSASWCPISTRRSPPRRPRAGRW